MMVRVITITLGISLLIIIPDDERVHLNEKNKGEQIYRRIQTLISWHAAASFLVKNAQSVRNVKATLITLDDR